MKYLLFVVESADRMMEVNEGSEYDLWPTDPRGLKWSFMIISSAAPIGRKFGTEFDSFSYADNFKFLDQGWSCLSVQELGTFRGLYRTHQGWT